MYMEELLGLRAVCVYGFNTKWVHFHVTSVSSRGQLDDSVKWDLQVRKLLMGLV